MVEAKRARAGRTVFLPGEWTELKAPYLPLESAMPASHLVRPGFGDRILAPFERVLPTAPLHEMFAEAGERLSGGPGGPGAPGGGRQRRPSRVGGEPWRPCRRRRLAGGGRRGSGAQAESPGRTTPAS
ncbi:hypothetical protein [Streptomyces sp. NPDC059949]|uniref:hypothetical protein n=1 Tax=Streptomyces sp. NPDC059949 TaxID=3347013 RepID=UPI00364C7DA5